MNRWNCEHPGCKNECVGIGSAIALRTIGWYFKIGPTILCPAHHPEGFEVAEESARKIQDFYFKEKP